MTVDPEALRVPMGSLLAAYPDLRDPNFMHTVLLMCEHSDQGAYGLALNRRTELSIGDLFPEHELLGCSGLGVYLGGPVDPNRFQFVHTVPREIAGGVPLTATLTVGGELDQLAAYLARSGAAAQHHVRAFVGYSGWAPGQLEAELATGSWIPAPLSSGALFGDGPDDPPEAIWRRVVRAADTTGGGLENLPPDASWN